ncbi:DMT family transporter [Paenirhodobacter sp.]|uniref:DMT family transporter n=1 Tax=Paenirhodobacter sp. TaxID=1965326 RepID=UPI003B3D89B1
MARLSPQQFGILITLVSAVMWSTAGLFVRMADIDIWSLVGWRSVFTGLTLGAWIALRPRGAMTFGLPGVVSTLISTVAAIAYIVALSWTSVANVMTVYAALPFSAGLIAWLWFRERVTARFILAGLVALAGVLVMTGAAMAPRDIAGIAVAVLMTVLFSAQLVIARRYPRLDSARMIALAAVLCVLIALPWMESPTPRALLACALYGSISTGLGYILVLIGGRLIGAGEAAFLSLIDVVLGPIWVWIFFAEAISPATMIGGGAVLAAVVWYLAPLLQR